jgi:hypothetical protein
MLAQGIDPDPVVLLSPPAELRVLTLRRRHAETPVPEPGSVVRPMSTRRDRA